MRKRRRDLMDGDAYWAIELTVAGAAGAALAQIAAVGVDFCTRQL